MNGNRSRTTKDWRASALVGQLMADRGWFPSDLERASLKTGHPQRCVSMRSVYRVLREGYIPTAPIQFEIAQAFGLLPSQIWGAAPLPAEYAYLETRVAA